MLTTYSDVKFGGLVADLTMSTGFFCHFLLSFEYDAGFVSFMEYGPTMSKYNPINFIRKNREYCELQTM